MTNNDFESKLDEYTNGLSGSSSKYMFLIKKVCGWGYLTVLPKDFTTMDLYRQVSLETENTSIRLYATENADSVNKSTYIPNIPNNNITLRKMVRDRAMGPVYEMPHPMVYCIILDDGHYMPEAQTWEKI